MRSVLHAVSKINPGSGAGDLLNQFCHLLEQHGINLDQIGNYMSSTAQPMPARLLPTFRSVVKALLEKKKLVIHYKSNKDPKPQEPGDTIEAILRTGHCRHGHDLGTLDWACVQDVSTAKNHRKQLNHHDTRDEFNQTYSERKRSLENNGKKVVRAS
jgi:hypothetical protein